MSYVTWTHILTSNIGMSHTLTASDYFFKDDYVTIRPHTPKTRYIEIGTSHTWMIMYHVYLTDFSFFVSEVIINYEIQRMRWNMNKISYFLRANNFYRYSKLKFL